MLAGTTGKDQGLQERAAGLAASAGLGAGAEQGLLVLVVSCAIVQGYDRRGGSEGDRTQNSKHPKRSDGEVGSEQQ